MGDSVLYVETSDNIIISDLLYYVSNKIRSTPVNTVITTCHNFYTDDDYVFSEKKKLCDATNEPCIARRNDKKRQSNIEDICAILTKRDSQSLFIPGFASVDMNNVPRNDEGNPTMGQIMSAIYDLKRNIVTTEMLSSSMKRLKEELSPSASSSSSLSRGIRER